MPVMLASDYDEGKLRFPLIGQPKIDGVRGVNLGGAFTGRSLKKHKNLYTTDFYSKIWFDGLDGEVAAARETDPDLCRITSSALGTIAGSPFTLWWVFDLVCSDTQGMEYMDRLHYLRVYVERLKRDARPGAAHLRVIPWKLITTLAELNEYDDENLEAGYEGTIARDPLGKHKAGRSTVREGGLLRIKRFIDAEAVVMAVDEGQTNGNEAQINELGKTFRSTHQANMSGNGMVGSIIARACKDVLDGGNLVIREGQIITISPGKLTHSERTLLWRNQQDFQGKIVKFKFFPKGIKDKPRFPVYIGLRDPEDM